MGDAFIIGSREAIILLAGAAVLLGTAFVAGRVLRSLRHGFSIRLQLFLAIFATATLSAAVIGFFEAQALTPERLRALSKRQTSRLVAALDHLDLQSPPEAAARGGFVAFRHPKAPELVSALRARGIYVDARDDMLRLGPAPYVTDDDLDAAAAALRALTR